MKTQIKKEKERQLAASELASFFLELALLVKAGVEISDAFFLLAEGEVCEPWKNTLRNMANRCEMGESLGSVLKDVKCFPPIVCTLVDISYQTGRVEDTLFSISKYFERQSRLREQLRNSYLHLMSLAGIMAVIIFVLLVKVLPVFEDVYESLGSEMTGVASGLLILGEVMWKILPLLCMILVAFVVVLVLYSANVSFQNKVHSVMRHRYRDKGINRYVNDAIIAQVITMCLGSGMTPEEAVDLACEIMKDNVKASGRLEDCKKAIGEGMSFSDAAAQSKILPPYQCRIFALGHRSGSAEEAMSEITRSLVSRVEHALEERMAKVEPVLIIVSSLFVGAVLLSVMLPLINVMNIIGY